MCRKWKGLWFLILIVGAIWFLFRPGNCSIHLFVDPFVHSTPSDFAFVISSLQTKGNVSISSFIEDYITQVVYRNVRLQHIISDALYTSFPVMEGGARWRVVLVSATLDSDSVASYISVQLIINSLDRTSILRCPSQWLGRTSVDLCSTGVFQYTPAFHRESHGKFRSWLESKIDCGIYFSRGRTFASETIGTSPCI